MKLDVLITPPSKICIFFKKDHNRMVFFSFKITNYEKIGIIENF